MATKNKTPKLRAVREENPTPQGSFRPSEFDDELLLEPADVRRWLGIGVRSLTELVAEGRIVSVKVLGARRKFLVRDVRKYIASLSTAGAEESVAEMIRANVAKARK